MGHKMADLKYVKKTDAEAFTVSRMLRMFSLQSLVRLTIGAAGAAFSPVPLGWQRSLIAWKCFDIKSYLNLFVENIVVASHERELLKLARERPAKEKCADLVSVVIPTFNRSNLLVSRSVPSILRQTYKNFEIIVVGDHCIDDTESKLKAFNDSRIKFVNLSKRGNYPKDPYLRWLVAGVAPTNAGAKIASGDWIAHLDDDDEFSEDHLEVLLKYALNNNYEMVYGVGEMETRDGNWVEIGSPIIRDGICHSASIFKAYLKCFNYDINSWKMKEPADFNLWRRMERAGVRMGFLNVVVAKHFKERN